MTGVSYGQTHIGAWSKMRVDSSQGGIQSGGPQTNVENTSCLAHGRLGVGPQMHQNLLELGGRRQYHRAPIIKVLSDADY